MNETEWVGPNGVVIDIGTGSRKPPRWALQLIDRVCYRENIGWLRLRWVHSSRNGSGYCYGRHHIAIRADANDDDRTRYLILHELAHAANRKLDIHGDGFYDSLVRVATAERATRLVRREHVRSHAKAPLVRAFRRQRETA